MDVHRAGGGVGVGGWRGGGEHVQMQTRTHSETQWKARGEAKINCAQQTAAPVARIDILWRN